MSVGSKPLPAPGEISDGRSPSNSLGRVSWAPNAEMEFADWIATGRRLGAVGRGCQWWLGDWIRYGKVRFGERYKQASRVTGYDSQTLMNMVYVASRFEISRRREGLSWSHHETIAALEPEEQDHWLDLAAAERLTVSDLRLEVRSAQRHREELTLSPRGSGDDAVESSDVTICPKCGHKIDSV